MREPAGWDREAPVGRPVRAVLFDVDGTLYHQDRLRVFMAAELVASPLTLRSIGSSSRVVSVLRTYRRVHEEMRQLARPDALVAELQIARTARRERVSEREVRAIVAEWMHRRPLKYLRWCRRRGLVALLSQLQQRGTRLGILSDYPSQDKLAALGVDRFFTQVLCTTDRDINALKPHPHGFQVACARWGVSPDEVLYVGDRSDVDGSGARAAGIPCAVFGRGARGRDGHQTRPIPIRSFDDVNALVCLHPL